MPTTLKHTYKLRITLSHIEPKIWRSVLVPSSITLDKLHTILQIVMGWMDTHLHMFVHNGKSYGIPDEFDELDTQNEKSVRISNLLSKEGDIVVYEYDFGDGWMHEVLLEKIQPFDTTRGLPACLDGERSCPPEDCGGAWGYQNLLEVITDPGHPEFDEMSEWLGDEFSAEYFDASETNDLLLEYAKC
ncbi:MAG: hypothetical protein ACI8UP_000583 [Porticoccaceae bacterium]|jgi:hypothetical protein